MAHDSTADTLDHISKVQTELTIIATELIERGRIHDASKLIEPEKSAYDILGEKLKGLPYGSPEYHAAINEVRPAINHHKAHNRHHPEFHLNGIQGMTLIDLVEMICDWRAAGLRDPKNPGNMMKSLDHAFERQRIPQPIYRILVNTIEELWPEKG